MDSPTATQSASAVPPLPGAVVLLAHGAGGHRDYPHILDLSATLRGLGLTVVRFNFPFREKALEDGRKRPPDRMPVLLETIRAVAEAARKTLQPKALILAGHSMGGRACSMAAAEGLPCDGLLLFSYPWHPPGKSDQPRTAHLGKIPVPVLALTGSRDPFCDRKAMGKSLDALPSRWTLRFLEEADHGLDVLKKSGRTREAVMAEVEEACGVWLEGLASRPEKARSEKARTPKVRAG